MKTVLISAALIVLVAAGAVPAQMPQVAAQGQDVVKLADGFAFTEGPAVDRYGNIFFTDQPNNKIYKWSINGQLSLWHNHPGRANGLYFDSHGNLIACADLDNELWLIRPDKSHIVLIDNYRGKLLNAPNDCWTDPKGGIYFTDPFYRRKYWDRGPSQQDGEHVYYLKPDHETLIRVADDLVQPNGIIGTPDGKTLYVADIRAGKTYAYDIKSDGTLGNKRLFAPEGSDGMTIDNAGNVYLTNKAVSVFSSNGKKLGNIEVPELPANVCIGGQNGKTLFITARTGLYAIGLKTRTVEDILEKVTAEEAELAEAADGLNFTEGPVGDAQGNLYFSDIPANRIYKLSPDGKLQIFAENLKGVNGLYFDRKGNLLACLGGARKVVSISPRGKVTTIAAEYKGKKFNSPNDLWVDTRGGIYFTDPRYGNRDSMEMKEHVYYITPNREKVIRVIDDMVRPNGLIGTTDAEKLYVTDHGDSKTFSYRVNPDGRLTDKKLLCSEGSDGMTIDEYGNVYLTTDAVVVFSPEGDRIQTIKTPQRPANVTFAGPDRKTLFITAGKSVYSIKTAVKGARTPVTD